MITVTQQQLQDVLNAIGLEDKTPADLFELHLEPDSSYMRYKTQDGHVEYEIIQIEYLIAFGGTASTNEEL